MSGLVSGLVSGLLSGAVSGLVPRALALLALLAGLAAGIYALERHVEQRGYDRAAAEYTTAINQLQADAAARLANQITKTRATEQALNTAKNTQELKDATHQKTIVDLSDSLGRAAGPADRLRDPHAAQCWGSGSGTAGDPAPAPVAGAADPAQAGGLLSAQLTEILRGLARDADDINAAYASCRADAYTVRQTP